LPPCRRGQLDKAERLAGEFGARAATDVARSSRTVDAAIQQHAGPRTCIGSDDRALEAAARLLEKPLVVQAADADGMFAAARKTDRTLMVAHVLRFWGKMSRWSARPCRQARQADLRPRRGCRSRSLADWQLNLAWSGGRRSRSLRA